MPRYYFNIYDDAVYDDALTLDGEGVEFVNVQATRAHAMHGAAVRTAEYGGEGYLTARHFVEIINASSATRQPSEFRRGADAAVRLS